MNHPTYALPFLQPGRLARIKYDDMDFGWGVVITYNKVNVKGKKDPEAEPEYILDVLLYCSNDSSASKDAAGRTVGIRPAEKENEGAMMAIPVSLNAIECLSHIRLNLPKNIRTKDALTSIYKSILEVKKRFPENIPLLDPVTNMGIKDPAFKKLAEKIVRLEKALLSHPLAQSEDLPALYDQYTLKMEVINKIKSLKRKIADAQSIVQLEELKNRKRVMRRYVILSCIY